METINKEYLTGYDLVDKVKQTVEKAEQVIKDNDWQIKGDINLLKKVNIGHFDSKNSLSMWRERIS